jgi:hypothetical protein
MTSMASGSQAPLTENTDLTTVAWANFSPTNQFSWFPITPAHTTPGFVPDHTEYPSLTPGKRVRSPPQSDASPTEPDPKLSRTGPTSFAREELTRIDSDRRLDSIMRDMDTAAHMDSTQLSTPQSHHTNADPRG